MRKSMELRGVSVRTSGIRPDDVLLLSTMRNENVRLPYFLSYYRDLGVNHFLIVDNDSTDGTGDYLATQPDVSLWHTQKSYGGSRYGVDWLNGLARRYACGHWTLMVDADEFFVYPFCDTRPIKALTDWLDSASIRSFGALLLDLYPKGTLNDQSYRAGQSPLEIANWFDSGSYTISVNPQYRNLWIQGGPRARVYFEHDPKRAPALNKIPLVKWDRRYVYVSSTHMMLPRGLNLVYDEWGGEKPSGVLLHTKLMDTLQTKVAEELDHGQHYAGSAEYLAYADRLQDVPDFWTKWSEQYVNWRQLEVLGLMSKGSWA